MKRNADMVTIQRALTLLSIECSNHKMCKACRLYFNNDCSLNKPPAHWEIGEIVMHTKPLTEEHFDEKIIRTSYNLKE